MKAKDLHTIWDAPDNSRLTSKQFTVRLPIRVAAQIAALNEIYPRKTKTELIGDLLAAALDEVAANLPTTNTGDEPWTVTSDGEEVWRQTGPGVMFPELVKKHLQELEAEEGREPSVSITEPAHQPRKSTAKRENPDNSKSRETLPARSAERRTHKKAPNE